MALVVASSAFLLLATSAAAAGPNPAAQGKPHSSHAEGTPHRHAVKAAGFVAGVHRPDVAARAMRPGRDDDTEAAANVAGAVSSAATVVMLHTVLTPIGARANAHPHVPLTGGAPATGQFRWPNVALIPPAALPEPAVLRPVTEGFTSGPLLGALLAVLGAGGLLGLRLARRPG